MPAKSPMRCVWRGPALHIRGLPATKKKTTFMSAITEPEWPAIVPPGDGPHAEAIERAHALFCSELESTEGWEDQGESEGTQLYSKPDPEVSLRCSAACLGSFFLLCSPRVCLMHVTLACKPSSVCSHVLIAPLATPGPLRRSNRQRRGRRAQCHTRSSKLITSGTRSDE